MSKNKIGLTVFFDAPFWVAVCERAADGKLEVCKVTFGAEPKDYEVYQFFLQNWNRMRFSPPVSVKVNHKEKINPKRMQRKIKKQLGNSGVGTKARQAMKLQQEQGKEAKAQRTLIVRFR